MSPRKINIPAAGDRAVRRAELHRLVGLGDTTIYELERRGDFPRRFNLTPRCVAWSLAEVEAWLETRRDHEPTDRAPTPDVHQRHYRPVRTSAPRDADRSQDFQTYRGFRLQKAVSPSHFPRAVLEDAVRFAIAKNRDRLAQLKPIE